MRGLLLFLFPLLLFSSTLERQCSKKNSDACYNAGISFLESDKKKGVKLLDRGCSYGNEKSCESLAYHYLNLPNYDQAINYLSASCDRDNFKSCHTLASLFERGEGTSIDTLRAKDIYNVSCLAHYGASCHNLALINHREDDFDLAKKNYKKGCDSEYYDSCVNLGNMYFASKNETLANQLYEIACDGQNGLACLNLATSYYYGTGVSMDDEKYLSLMSLSCKYGEETACEILKKENE